MAIEARKNMQYNDFHSPEEIFAFISAGPSYASPVAPSHHRAVFAHVAKNTVFALFLATNASACSAPQLGVLRLVEGEGPVQI